MSILKDCTKYIISGIVYVTIEDFSKITKRTRTALNQLIRKGNKYRKLKVFRPSVSQSYVPVQELFDFPFTDGNIKNGVYHYNEEGEKIPDDKMNQDNADFDKKYKDVEG